jgi:hypothetical protein
MGSGSLKAGLQGVSVDQVAQLQGAGGRWWRRRFLMLGLVPRGTPLQMLNPQKKEIRLPPRAGGGERETRIEI